MVRALPNARDNASNLVGPEPFCSLLSSVTMNSLFDVVIGTTSTVHPKESAVVCKRPSAIMFCSVSTNALRRIVE